MQRKYVTSQGEPIDAPDALTRGGNKKDYFKALVDPEVSGYGAKCPSIVAIPSCTFQDVELTDVTVGAGGEAYIAFSPLDQIWEGAVAADLAPVRILSAKDAGHTYGGTWGSPTAPAANGWSTNASMGYIQNTFGSSNAQSIRIVSACLEITYQGRADSCSGMISSAVVFSGAALRSAFNINEAFKSKLINFEYFSQRGSAEGTRLLYFPVDGNCFEFSEGHTSLAGSDKHKNDTRAIYLIALTGVPVGTSFQIRLCTNYEYVPLQSQRELLQPRIDDVAPYNSDQVVRVANSMAPYLTNSVAPQIRNSFETVMNNVVQYGAPVARIVKQLAELATGGMTSQQALSKVISLI